MSVKAAGCLFIQNDYVLAAYNPHHKIWSGLGGKLELGESLKETAFRETIEELFGFSPSRQLIDDCIRHFSEKKVVIRKEYGIIPLSFDEYSDLANKVKSHDSTSPYYKHIPDTFIQLLSERDAPEDAEITTLKIVKYTHKNPDAPQDLIDDSYAALHTGQVKF